MEASVVEQEGAPSENGAEATRSAAHLFQYSAYVHVGEGAEECPQRETGTCKEPAHFHGWVCLPNPLQRRDVLEKARATKARRRRAMKDAGDATRPASDAYVTLEADLDALLDKADRENLLREIGERAARKGSLERIRDLIASEDRYENYWQDREEWERLKALDEETRPTEEFKSLDEEMSAFESALETRTEEETEREIATLKTLSEGQLRDVVREVRIDGEAAEAHLHAFYMWMGFISTRVPNTRKRFFPTLDDYRNEAPEVIEAIEDALRDLEGRMSRGDASGN